ncbi:hypothetical protein ACFPM0_07065 [Pseudonocardia sulfidoxydans]
MRPADTGGGHPTGWTSLIGRARSVRRPGVPIRRAVVRSTAVTSG